MSARDEILGRIAGALDGADRSVVHVPRGYRDRPAADGMLDLFVERAEDYRATVTRCADAEVPAVLASVLPAPGSVLVPDGFGWSLPGGARDTGLTALELDGYAAVVSEVTGAIAETGTLVLTHGPGQGRRAISLVPDLLVCVVRESQVVADVPAVFALLDPSRPQTWISGPSATSDIELDRVEGVHGPRVLHVLLVG